MGLKLKPDVPETDRVPAAYSDVLLLVALGDGDYARLMTLLRGQTCIPHKGGVAYYHYDVSFAARELGIDC